MELRIPGLEIKEEIGRGGQSVVYRVLRGGENYALKVFSGDLAQNPKSGRRFLREAEALARTCHIGLVQVMEVGEAAGRPYMVLEYIEGRTLAEEIKAGPMSETRVLELTKVLAEALKEIHSINLVHRDIKPSNIIIDREERVRLIDFGLATSLVRSETQPVPGTLLYSSPEQTGMLKRPVDNRSDLYSLGVVLFECVTGQPPFYAADPNELIRLHISVKAADADKLAPALSHAFSRIIAKLLSKDPDDRYQSDAGLLYDLEKIDVLNEQFGMGQELVLGSYDIYGAQSLWETALIGRQDELNLLGENLEKANAGHGRAVLIEGLPGCGKSRLCFEFINEILRSQVLVLKGKGVEVSPHPFSVVRSMLEEYGSFLQKMPQKEREAKENELREMVGSFAPILKNFCPLFSTLFKEVKEVSVENAQELLLDGLVHLMQEISRSRKNLVLFIDDIQWLDENSREAFKRLVGNLPGSPILILAAGRSDPANLEKIEQFATLAGNQLANRIKIENLSGERINELLRSYLQTNQLGKEFSEALLARTEGNPFAIGEYLRSMLDADLLRPSWGNWQVNLQGLDKLNLPKDILDLAIRRISDLGGMAQNILTRCAVIGAQFELENLPEICDASLEEIYGAISESHRVHVIERIGKKYRFVHDRLQEALLANLSSEELKEVHQKIAVVLDKAGGEGREYIYSLAIHYAQGNSRENHKRVYETNLRAGLIALESYVPNEGYAFFKIAEGFSVSPDFVFEKSLGIACFQTGKMEEASLHLNQTLKLTENKLELVDIRIYLSAIQMADIQVDNAIEEIKQAFRGLKKPFPTAALLSFIKNLGIFFIWNFLDRFNLFYGASKGQKRKELMSEVKLLNQYTKELYIKFSPLVMVQIIFRTLFLSHLIGDSRETSFIYANYGLFMFATMGKEKGARKYALKALEVAKRISDPPALDRAAMLDAAVPVYLGYDREGTEKFLYGYKNHSTWMDEQDYNNMIGMLCWQLYLSGTTELAIEIAKKYLQRQEQRAYSAPIERSMALGCLSGALSFQYLGNAEKANSYFSKGWQIIEKMGWQSFPITLRGAFILMALPYFVEKENVGEEFENLLQQYGRLNIPLSMTDASFTPIFINQGYGRLLQIRRSGSKDFKPLEQALKQLRAVAKRSIPAYANQYILEAALKNLMGLHKTALVLLSKAEEIAQKADRPQVHIDLHREKARTFNAMGNFSAGTRSAQAAYDIAARYGWIHRVNQIRQEFDLGSKTPAGSSEYVTDTQTSQLTNTGSLRLQRYLDALLKVSLASAAMLDPDQQIRAALDEIIRILGAERAYLFLCKTDCQELELKAGRDARQIALDLKAASFSSEIVEEVRKSRKLIVESKQEEKSILAAPLIIRGDLIGIIYLSNRLAKGVFTGEDADILLAMSNHIAIALDAARTIQIELERAALEKVKAVLEQKVKERTKELKATYEKLAHAEKLAALGKLGGAISHEVRTPLAIIKNSAELLRDLLPSDNPDIKKCLGYIFNETDKASLIVSDILNFVRIKMPELGPVKIADLISESVSRIARLPAIKVEVGLPSSLPPALADRGQLEQVFNNLIQNAYQAMPQGGTLKINTSSVDGKVLVKFADTGEGIPKENLSKVFELLFTTKPQGTGFGLAICQTIIEGLGGKITVESEAGKGSVFTVILPASGTG